MKRILLPLLLLAACAREPAIPEMAQPLPVRLEKAGRAAFQPTLVLLGTVRPSGEAEVTVPAAGRLRYPPRFKDGLSSGTRVGAGEVLARLYNPESELSLSEATLRLQSAKSELERYQKAFDLGLVSAAQLAQYKVEADLAAERLVAARQQRSSLDLRSPVSGWLLVERRLPPEGDVPAGTVLARLAAGGPARVEGRAAAGDRPHLRPGLAVRFVVPGAPGAAGRGTIREVSPLVEAGGTIPLVADVTEGAAMPAPGEGVEIHVELDTRTAALTVPEEALLVSEGGDAVWVAEARAARRRPVETGARGGGRVEILRGLSPGDKVVVGGASLLSEGDSVTEIKESETGNKEKGR
ncbi:MAG TPA: efflux RND transporter periplasmic adaptor subunit [Thermoanaerobaculia bacterium]|nr:efflux RND transporter periplasmic adaptor subunit [Thermoanaerobaculia bacterium]